MERVPLRKGERFEIFKRDGFTCRYCGSHPPDVMLHVDHLVPVVEGGTNNAENLVTACQNCNLGKSSRPLNEKLPPFDPQASTDALERAEQLNAYTFALREQADAHQEYVDFLRVEVGAALYGEGLAVNAALSSSVEKFVGELGLDDVRSYAQLASDKIRSGLADDRWRYFCGICWRRIREANDAE